MIAPSRRALRPLVLLALAFAAACARDDALRTESLEESWSVAPGSRLRPAATVVFDESGERRLLVCCESRIFAVPETGAGLARTVWDPARPVEAIAAVGGDQGLLVIEASVGGAPSERLVWTDLAGGERVVHEEDQRSIGVPLRVGLREAWMATSSRGGDETAVLLTADLQGRRPLEWRPADLDAVYHIARDPHSGRTLVGGARREGRRAVPGVFELNGEPSRARLALEGAWCPQWSAHGRHLAFARGTFGGDAETLRYGPLENVSVRVEGPNGRVREDAVDGVVLALCFDPTDEELLFAVVADPDEVRAGDLRSARVLRYRVGAERLTKAEIAHIALDGDGDGSGG